MDATDLLSKKTNKILNYLYGLQQENSSFISSSGATFASVASKVSTLNSAQISDMLYSYILQKRNFKRYGTLPQSVSNISISSLISTAKSFSSPMT